MSVWCCVICKDLLCSYLISAEDAWNLGLVSFGAEVWAFYPSDTPSRALSMPFGGSRNRFLQLTRASFERPDWDLAALGATGRWKKLQLTPSDLLEG